MPVGVSDFIASLTPSPRRFPPDLQDVYATVVDVLRGCRSAAGFDAEYFECELDDPTPAGVARRLFRWFPTHFFKFQDALLRCEQRRSEAGSAVVLERPRVTFVDLGCGAGAASAAVLATLAQYRDFCQSARVRPSGVKVHLVAVDQSPAELNVFAQVVGGYGSKLAERGIEVEIDPVCTRFPEGACEIVDALSVEKGQALVIGMSNLINWIWPEWEEELAVAETLGGAGASSAEIEALTRIAEQADFDVVYVIGVATKRSRLNLGRKLHDFLDVCTARLAMRRRPYAERWGSEARVLFENPEGCAWAARHRTPVDYFVQNMVDIAPAYARDTRLRDALSHQSLEAAWAKVRSYMLYESVTDEVELRLFETELGLNLSRLGAACRERDYACLNIDSHRPYEFPKDEAGGRPRSLACLEEQIVGASVAINSADQLRGECAEVSYSYRLAPRRSEFLYEYWFASYREYLCDVLNHLGDGDVCIADIRSYYTNVPQAALLDVLEQRFGAGDRSSGLLAATIKRDCGPTHDDGYGLIQGHSLSGLLGNLMLQPVDLRLVKDLGMRGRYFRFTDDFTVTQTQGKAGNTVELIQKELSELDDELQLNDDKTEYLDQRAFTRRAYGSKGLNTLSKRFRALLLPLFIVNPAYRREFEDGQWEFVYRYQDLLQSAGIGFTPGWLYRKLDEHRRWSRRTRAGRRRWRLSWPAFSLTTTAAGRLEWQRQFCTSNEAWHAERRALKNELTELLVSSAESILDGEVEKERLARLRRVVKFAVYRLSVLGIEDAAIQTVALLVRQPWNVPAGIACRALARAGLEASLVEAFQRSATPYVRAMALRALGGLRSRTGVTLLASVLDGAASHIEKLMASEGLLDANLWRDVGLESIEGWLEQAAEAPYLEKNIVLILGQAYPERSQELLSQMARGPLADVVCRAVHYVLNRPAGENLLWKAEPEVLRKYRAKYYPIIEELLSDPGSYGFVSE